MERLHWSLAAICAVLLWCCMAAARADDAGSGPDTDWRPTVLELRVNGVLSGQDAVALRDAGGGLWLSESDFVRLRLRLPAAPPHVADGKRYYPVAAIPGAKVAFDEARSSASISAPAAAFLSSSLALLGLSRPPMSKAGMGAFFNYELYGQTGQYSGADVASGYGELGIFSPLGVLINTGTGQTIGGVSTFVRLESTFSHDFPDSLETLRLGDTVNVPGSWANAVRFGGLQWGTNYGIRPDLVTTPLLAATGTAVVPSTVDVFVNGRAVGSSQVPAGPFVVNQLPAINGSGDVNIVVRNALGQEQIISVPFYSAAVMLQPGLSLYDIDLGPVRENYGLTSGDYGPLIASGTWRRGFTSLFTGEIHAEAMHGGPWAAGIDLAQGIDHWAVVTADLAVGGQSATSGLFGSGPQPASSGGYAALGIQRVNQRFSIILEAQHATSGFRELGDAGVSGVPVPLERNLAQFGWNMGKPGNLQLAWVEQRNPDDTRQQSFGVTYSVNIGRGSFSATLSRTTGLTQDTYASAFYVLPLDSRRNTSTQVRYDSQQPSPKAALVETLQKNLPPGPGEGYLLSAGTDASYNLQYLRQLDALLVNVQAARYLDSSAQSLTLSGGTTLMDGEVHATRTVTDSFATVEVGGVPDVTIYYDNQPVARTDEAGLAVVRDLRSYDVNRLSIDPLQLPLDAAVDNPKVQVVPPYRSGVQVDFPVKRIHAGLFRLQRDDGSPVPAGATVTLSGEDFPVGLEGLAYVTNYDHGTSGEARWNGGKCRFRLPPPPAGEPQPDVGVIACRSAP
ncbi:MAG TPA: fimbria/pilus outer membrane usher protein [Steroidobacteraceae bacterium]|nr:fimbria/pilus outer membrane usher protein [Steroidobacteraceae bacterium]